MESKKPDSEKMATLSEAINQAVKHGYKENFKFLSIGLTTEKEERYYSSSDIRITNFFRFEGQSDPQDNAILYLIETTDRKKGILVDAHGAYADTKLSDFIREVEDK